MGEVGDLNFGQVVGKWVLEGGIKVIDRLIESTMTG
jgi:hypothetical protein